MSDTLKKISDDLAQTVEAAGPSIVRVAARRRLPASGIVWSSDGTIVTAHHVIERDDSIEVGLPDGGTATATLAGRDPTTDIAVLRTSVAGLAEPQWRGADSLRVGNIVLALGRPGKSVLASMGIVSALGESWRTPAGGRLDHYLQTDVVMYPGFSGGPLVDSEGHIVGLNTSALSRGAALAVPFDTLRRVVEALLSRGRIRRGYLGVGAQPARLPDSLAKELGQETGLLLVSVEAGSPAEQSGLLMGDTLVTLNGNRIRHLDDLFAALGEEAIGQPVPAKLVRGGKLQDAAISIGERE